MRIVNFDDTKSIVGQYMAELRDVGVQTDMMRFRANLARIGAIFAYEISKELNYERRPVETPLGTAECEMLSEQVVLGTIFRAGLPFHQGFLDCFDKAQNAFVSAYRKYKDDRDEFDVFIEYLASPRLDGKTLILADPMLATGTSMELAYRALVTRGEPARVDLASVVASQRAVDYLEKVMPAETTLWVGAIDPHLNEHSYIVPGLGDAGDLAYGNK